MKMGAFEILLSALGAEFRKAGDALVVAFGGEPIAPVQESLRVAGVRWSVLPGWADGPDRVRAWGFVFPALRLLRQERPDCAVVHFGNEIPMVVTILLARLLGMGKTKWIWQQHQQVKDPGIFGKHVSRLRQLNLFVTHFVAVYDGGRESMMKRGIPSEKITVIPNAVTEYTPTRSKGWLRQELGIPSDEIILATIGSLIPRKRIGFILRACAALGGAGKVAGPITTQQPNNPTTKLPPWRLLIIGEGPEREQLATLTRELGISERVHFLGLRNDIRDILPECGIYVHASSAETCTYSVTESMAAGIPAVVLDAGAAKDQIQEGLSGYVIEAADLEIFSARIGELMMDLTKRVEMGRMAEGRWRSKFTMRSSARAYHDLYRHLGSE